MGTREGFSSPPPRRCGWRVAGCDDRRSTALGARGSSANEGLHAAEAAGRPRLQQQLQQHHAYPQLPDAAMLSLYSRLHQQQQQQQQEPEDDGLLQQLLAPPSREHYLKALRQVARSEYLSHLQRPVLPVDLRPWLQHELREEEKKLAALAHRMQQLQQQQNSSSSTSSTSSSSRVPQELQHLRDQRIAVLHQIQYLKERLHALEVLLSERQPPSLLLQLLRTAAQHASQGPHEGTGPAAAVLAAAAAAEGSAAAQAADPLSATLSAADASDFPVTVPPAAVAPHQQDLLRRHAIVPRWLLGKGLGSLTRPQGLGREADELGAFIAAGWAEDFPLLQRLPGEGASEAAERRLQAAAVRLCAGYDEREAPLQYKQRMQQLLLQQQQQQQQQEERQQHPQQQQQQQQWRQRQAAPATAGAALAAAALELQEEARKAGVPASVQHLLGLYAHQAPNELTLRGTTGENVELVQRAVADLQQLFFRLGASAVGRLPEEEEEEEQSFGVSRQVGGAQPDPLQSWVDQQHRDMRRQQQQDQELMIHTAVLLAKRKLAAMSNSSSSSNNGSNSSGKSSSSSIRAMGRRALRRSLREQREAIVESIEEARFMNVTEKYLDLLQRAEGKEAVESLTRDSLSPAARAAAGDGDGDGVDGVPVTEAVSGLVVAPGEDEEQQADSLEARQRRVEGVVRKASSLLSQRAAECLGSRAVAAGGRVFPGMLVKGRVVRVMRQAAILDIGVGCDAWLWAEDVLLPLEQQPRGGGGGGLRQLIKEGDSLYCIVSVASAKELRVSLLPLRQLAAWEVLAKAAQTQEMLVATKQQAIPGGLVVRVLGVQGFLPASHICDSSLLQPPQQQQKHQQPVVVQVLHADVSRRRLLVSQRLPLSRTELLRRKVAPGDLVNGIIVDLHSFGCVVEFGSSRALLHVSEISHFAVDPTLLFRKGEAVRALVKSYDPVTGKIWVSTKALEAYPGQMLREKQKVFEEAEAAAEKYKEQQVKMQQLQEAAAQQLMRSLGIEKEEALTPPHLQTRGEASALENRSGLWWGLHHDSKLMQFLERRLQQQQQSERASAAANRGAADEATNAFSSLEEAEAQSETLTPLPGGGAVKVRVLRDLAQGEAASVLASSAEEALQIKNALQQSRVILRGNWQVPKVTEGPLQNDEWNFV
ncbi:hypothetical protein ACSSS7_005081 [Eimeria intestinalis]